MLEEAEEPASNTGWTSFPPSPYDATGKELFRHTGFFGKEDILAKWKELGVNL